MRKLFAIRIHTVFIVILAIGGVSSLIDRRDARMARTFVRRRAIR